MKARGMLLGIVLVAACPRPEEHSSAPPAAPVPSAPAMAPAPDPVPDPVPAAPRSSSPRARRGAPPPSTIVDAGLGATSGEPLKAEEREANPRSEKVHIKIWAFPDATIFWGAKNLGLAGRTALELERPRGSGPVEIEARADGYLPFHTRLHTDRDDKITIRLAVIEDAPAMLGFRPGWEAARKQRSGAVAQPRRR